MKILFIFIDGLGIGEYNPKINPCTDERLKIFNNFVDQARGVELPYGGVFKSIDPTLGVPGLPQSATGQTALLTGVNAAKLLNKHLSGYPNRKLRDILAEGSLLKKLGDKHKAVAFINAYRPVFFEHGPEKLLKYLSVTSIANWKAGLPFFSINDIRAERAIYHDFTNWELRRKEIEVPAFTAEKAGNILAKSAFEYDFCLYEYFKTDKAGHSQDLHKATALLIQLEQFILTVLKKSNLDTNLIFITSDHGNIEDLSQKTHTYNAVPLLAWGKDSELLLSLVDKIEDIAHVIVNMLA